VKVCCHRNTKASLSPQSPKPYFFKEDEENKKESKKQWSSPWETLRYSHNGLRVPDLFPAFHVVLSSMLPNGA
jgi:hypothetical protein